MRRTSLALRIVLPAVMLPALTGYAADPKPVRARPPVFPDHVVEIFSGDARGSLAGPKAPVTPPVDLVAPTNQPTSSTDAAPSNLAWTRLISADALEDEIKSYKPLLAVDLGTPRSFRATGYKKCRRDFNMLAVCFAIGADYDAPFRWQRQASVARDLFSQAAQRCAQPSDGVFEEARHRADDLDALLRGDELDIPDSTLPNHWKQLVDRTSLMSRMEQAQQRGLVVWTANSASFTRSADKIRREAMILATLAEVIVQPGCESADDKEFVGFAKTLQKNCLEVLEGVKANNFEQTRKAVGNVTKSCTACHAAYR